MPDDAKQAGRKKNVRNAAIVGTVALVIGVAYFWAKNRQAGAPGSGTDTTGGVTGSGFTDMGDIVQTVQGPPGKTGPAGKTGPRGNTGPPGKDRDRKPRRKPRIKPRGSRTP